MSTVFCLASDGSQAIRILNRLQAAGLGGENVSVLHSDRYGNRELSPENATKAPEGATVGAGTGAILGGTIGWLAGIGTLAIPGLGPLIAAGPIIGALSGLAVGGTIGGLSGALIGLGIPEYEAQQYASRLKDGKVLISVHVDNSDEGACVRKIMVDEQGEAISTGSETAVSSR